MSYLQLTDHFYFVFIFTLNNYITYTLNLPQNTIKPFLVKVIFSKDFVTVPDNDEFTILRGIYCTSMIFRNRI